MPELPEVETIRRGLKKQIVSWKIKKIIIKKPNLVKQSVVSFRRGLIGGEITKIDRIGKLLIFSVVQFQNGAEQIQTNQSNTKDNNSKLKYSNFNQNYQFKDGKFKIQNYLLIHLKMTGQLVFCDKDSFVAGGHANSKKEEEEFLNGQKDEFCQPGKYTHIIFDLEKQQRGLSARKEGKTSMLKARLFFNDLRQFGILKVVDEKELKEIKSKYGIEPGRANFTLANFKKALQNRKTTIKALLLNQAIISGLGNIYVDESLFASKIHPQRRADSLTSNEQKRLFNAIKRIIKLAIENNGTTFSDFVNSKGERGNFKQKLKVYGRKGKPCLRKNCPGIIQKIKVAGRGTYFCRVCQRL